MGEKAKVDEAWASILESLHAVGLEPQKVVGEQDARAMVAAKVPDPFIAAAVIARWKEVSPVTFGGVPQGPANGGGAPDAAAAAWSLPPAVFFGLQHMAIFSHRGDQANSPCTVSGAPYQFTEYHHLLPLQFKPNGDHLQVPQKQLAPPTFKLQTRDYYYLSEFQEEYLKECRRTKQVVNQLFYKEGPLIRLRKDLHQALHAGTAFFYGLGRNQASATWQISLSAPTRDAKGVITGTTTCTIALPLESIGKVMNENYARNVPSSAPPSPSASPSVQVRATVTRTRSADSPQHDHDTRNRGLSSTPPPLPPSPFTTSKQSSCTNLDLETVPESPLVLYGISAPRSVSPLHALFGANTQFSMLL